MCFAIQSQVPGQHLDQTTNYTRPVILAISLSILWGDLFKNGGGHVVGCVILSWHHSGTDRGRGCQKSNSSHLGRERT